MGAGAKQDDAVYEATTSCESHMLQMVAIQSLNNRASVKQSCQVTSCR